MIRKSFLEFTANWNKEKAPAETTLAANRKYNAKLKAGKEPGKSFPQDKKNYSLKNLKSSKNLIKDLPKHFYNEARLSSDKYKITGSIGQGNLAEIPWICIFDLDITSSAQEGFYIAYLFKSDMSGVYLSLNQGWTQYEKAFNKPNERRSEITRNVNYARNLLKGTQGFNYESIDLKATKSLGKGYEMGNICSVYYDTDRIPSTEVLINDLRNLIGVYRELKGLVGSDILNIRSGLNEEYFQKEIQVGNRVDLQPGAIQRKQKKQNTLTTSWSRDPNIAFTSIENSNFLCENDHKHLTFISEVTGHQFVEAHHLIPMKYQGDFEFSLDVPENIISLCPTCHRAFHNSVVQYKEELISSFHNERHELLQQREIEVTLEKLLEYYNI